MFWKFNLLTSHIDTLLDKEDVTLHEILDEDDVLQECKAQNAKLLEFLVKSEHIEELVNLITTEPSEESEERVRYKFPNTACELLTSDVTQINDKLASEDALLAKIYGFLESEAPLNPLLASFFSKVMGLLITRKSEMMLEFLKNKDDFMGQLLRHLGTSAIMDLLLRLITCIEATDTRTACITWLCEQNLVQKLIAMIDPSEPEEKHCNAAQSLCDIIRLSREQMSQLQEKAEPDPLLQALESEENVSSLLNHMFNGERVESVVVNGLAVIQTLLEFRKLGPEGAEAMTSLDAERLAHGVTNTIAALTPRLSDVHQILVDPPKQYFSPMPTTLGPLDPPLGNARLQVAKLLATLLNANTHSLNVVLENLGTFNVLLELFFKYSWSNFLHTQVEVCIATVLSSTPADVDGNQETPLLNQLLGDTKLVQMILEKWEENEQEQSRPNGQRKGYMGHLTHMANQVVEQMEKGTNTDKIKEAIQELPAETKEKWESFVSGTLADINKQNTVELVGRMPLHSSSEDDDPDFNNIPFPQDTAMQQAFSDYQLQQMTSNFIDQFGFNEDEFAEPDERVDAPFTDRISSINFDINSAEDNQNAATLFEQACNERIQQLDDQDSDEDLWEEKEITFSSTVTRPSDVAVKSRLSGEAGNDSDGSSDSSEEDLDSPRVIRSAPVSSSSGEPVVTGSGGLATSEKMDIDSDWQANFDDVPMEPSASASVAMDTTSNPWENSNATSSPSPPSVNTSGEGWADFDSTTNSNAKPASSSKDDEEWADFTGFSSLDSQNLSATAPESQQRSTSPVAMDTADSTSNRTQAYLVSSAPADLASEASSAVAADSSPSSSSSNSHSEQLSSTSQTTSSQPQLDDVPSSTSNNTTPCGSHKLETDTGDVSSTTTSSSDVNASSVIDNANDLNSNNAQLSSVEEISSIDEPPPLPTQPPPNDLDVAVVPDSTHAHTGAAAVVNDKHNATEQSYDDDDEDLSANFNFLASSGLMKNVDSDDSESRSCAPDSSPGGDGTVTTNSGAIKSAEQDKLEQVRAQAKEALEEYTAAANTKRQNGPV